MKELFGYDFDGVFFFFGGSWLGDNKLALMDVNTESTTVQTTLSNWISSFVQEYGVDGLRIDGMFDPSHSNFQRPSCSIFLILQFRSLL